MANILQSLGAEPCYGGFADKMWGWSEPRGPEEPETHVCCNFEDRERAAPVPPLQKERKEPLSLGEAMCISGGGQDHLIRSSVPLIMEGRDWPVSN